MTELPSHVKLVALDTWRDAFDRLCSIRRPFVRVAAVTPSPPDSSGTGIGWAPLGLAVFRTG